MNKNLIRKGFVGFLWCLFDIIGSRGVSFLIGVILARILSPSEYGVITISMSVVVISQILIDGGFASALIREKDLKDEDLSTSFIFNMIVSFFCCLILFFIAPYLANFFSIPELKNIIRILSINLPIGVVCSIQHTILEKRIDFKVLARISLVSVTVSGFVGIGMAYYGCSVWSLVVQIILQQIVRMILLFFSTSWIPSLGWSKDSFLHLWNFGSKIMLSSLLNSFFSNVSMLIIGKFFTPYSLGVFSVAEKLSNFPSSMFTNVIQRVGYPVLCSMQRDEAQLRINYSKILKLSTFSVFPLMTFLSANADPIIRIVYGEKWLDSIPLMQIICFSMMFYPIHAINLNLLQVKGKSDIFLMLEIIKITGGIFLLSIAVPRGIFWVAGVSVIGSLFALLINTYYTGKYICLGLMHQFIMMSPAFVGSMFVFICIQVINSFISDIYIQLFIDVILTVTISLSALRFFCAELYLELRKVIEEYIKDESNSFCGR